MPTHLFSVRMRQFVQTVILSKAGNIRETLTLRRVLSTIVAVEKQHPEYYIFWVCVCIFCYPTCNAHELNCHPWPVRFYNSFQHYLIYGTIFEKKVTERRVCVFPVQFLSETFSYCRKKCYLCKVPAILGRFNWNSNFLDTFSENVHEIWCLSIFLNLARKFKFYYNLTRITDN